MKTILKRVWTLPGQRPLALVEPRYDWRYLVAYAHPASGRTLWQLADGVSADIFSVELKAFAADSLSRRSVWLHFPLSHLQGDTGHVHLDD